MGKGLWLTHRARLAIGLLVAFGAVMTLHLLPAETAALTALLVRTVTAIGVCVAIGLEIRRSGGRARVARLLIGFGLLCGVLGGIVAIGFVATTGETLSPPAVSGGLYFAFLGLCVAGLVCYPVSDEHAGSVLRILLDGLLAASALWFVIYLLVLEPAKVPFGLGAWGQLERMAHPAAAVILIGIICSVLMRSSRRARRELVLTGAGLALIAVQDLVYSALLSTGQYRPDSWLPVAGEAGLLLILLGALRPASATGADEARDLRFEESTVLDRLLPTLPFVPVVMAVAVAALFAISRRPLDAAEYTGGLIVLVLLLLHQWVGNRDRATLYRRITEREELFRSMVTGSSDLITLHDETGTIVYASPPLARMIGVDEDKIAGACLDDFVHPEDREAVRNAITEARHDVGSTTTVMSRLRTTDNSWRWMQTVMHNQFDDPIVAGIVCNTRDVHEQHLLRQRLGYDAYHDALTGLGNLAQARAIFAEQCYGPDRALTNVVLVDLDGFKTLNDTFGHGFGDALLVAIGRRLRTCVTDEDAVARIGGDEFVLVFDALEDPKSLAPGLVLDALRRVLLVEGTYITVEASVGVARSVDAKSPNELLRNADLAMYAAKSAGRNQIVWYEDWMFESTATRLRMQEGLRRALDEGNFSLNYQPIVSLPQGQIVGAEALLRWDDPEHGRTPPDVFIPIAEGSGIIADIDSWVLNEACRQLAVWNRMGKLIPRLSINVSRRQLTAALPGLVAETLAKHGVEASQLCIEATESTVVPDADAASEVLASLRTMGVAIALDDFGTGQSSLSQLAKLPIDRVKIDKSFVMTSSSDADALRFLRSIVGVCRSLALPIIAEGIEDREAADNLASMGCEFGQGYFFARPQPAAEFAELLAPTVPAAIANSQAARLPQTA